MNSNHKPVAVVVGATSKWQADGWNTKLAHGREIDDSDLPVGARWSVGGAIAQKFAQEGFFMVLTTRRFLLQGDQRTGRGKHDLELDLTSRSLTPSPRSDRLEIRMFWYTGYLEGRDLPPEKELLEHIPLDV